MKKLTVLIPCHNEEAGIGLVMDNIPVQLLRHLGYRTNVVVIDNNSKDKTAEVALSKGAKVIEEPSKGKGNALISGFKYVNGNSDYIVVIDGDNTYKAKEIPRLIEPLESGFCDVIAGSRLGGKIMHDSFDFPHRFINWICAFFVRQFYKANITDALTGFIAFKSGVVKILIPNLSSTNFTIEMEMMTKLRRLGFNIYSVPITYDRRKGKSKIHPYKDGLQILLMFISNLRWKPIRKRRKSQIFKNGSKTFLIFRI
ncbi:MAG: glycosyltransferase family 2 protein [Candidatus Microgenomates bacterium]|jgi:glycosyltransferase involved in cell wall biosynthesis